MKTWGRVQCKHLFSLGSASEAVTPVVGSLLMLLILVVLAGAVSSVIFNSVGEDANPEPLIAKITIESCEGGLFNDGPEAEQATLENNTIVLLHEGGSSLPLDTVSIKISGYGNSYQGIADGNGTKLVGSTEVFYRNLSPTGKNDKYVTRNSEVLKDGFWNAGEKLILSGKDSSTSVDSSVEVSVNGDSNTSDNYGFKADSEIILEVIDFKSNNFIAQHRAIVRHAD